MNRKNNLLNEKKFKIKTRRIPKFVIPIVTAGAIMVSGYLWKLHIVSPDYRENNFQNQVQNKLYSISPDIKNSRGYSSAEEIKKYFNNQNFYESDLSIKQNKESILGPYELMDMQIRYFQD
jgi:hypothetical protein